MKIEDIITQEELREILEEQHHATLEGETARQANTDFIADCVPGGYCGVLGEYVSIETGAAMYRMLAYIAYNLQRKAIAK